MKVSQSLDVVDEPESNASAFGLKKGKGRLKRTRAGSDTRRNLKGQIMGKHEYRLPVWEIEEREGVRVKFLFHPIAYPGGRHHSTPVSRVLAFILVAISKYQQSHCSKQVQICKACSLLVPIAPIGQQPFSTTVVFLPGLVAATTSESVPVCPVLRSKVFHHLSPQGWLTLVVVIFDCFVVAADAEIFVILTLCSRWRRRRGCVCRREGRENWSPLCGSGLCKIDRRWRRKERFGELSHGCGHYEHHQCH